MTNEAELQAALRIEASRRGWRLWRNNTGMAYDNRGIPVRFGLGNESAAVNARVKSSDLIGITPVVVTLPMVGQTVGIFTSIEVKRPGWHYTGTQREEAQAAWINLIVSLGGIGKFVSSLEGL